MADSLGSLLVAGLFLLAGGLLLATGISAALGFRLLLTGALSILSTFMGSPTGRGGFKSSPTYGWDYLSNKASSGSPLPFIYGEHQVAPALISVNLKTEGKKQVLYALYAVCEGEIESIHSVRLNDTPIDQFPDAVATTDRLGTAAQTAITDFNQIGAAHDAGTALGNTGSHVHEMRDVADELAIALTWPGGFYKINDNGDVKDVYWTAVVQVKPYGAPDTQYAYYNVPSGTSDWSKDGSKAGTWTRNEKTTSPFRSQIRLKFDGASGRPARGRYVVKITADLGASTQATRAATVTSILEVNNDARTYANVALLALKLPANEQLSGQLPKVTCVVKGRKVYDPRTGTTAWSQNPILCLRDFLLHARFGTGRWISDGKLDDGVGGTWRAAMDACDATVLPVTGGAAEARYQLDYVGDVKAPAKQHWAQMLAGCGMHLFAAQRKVRIAMDAASASVRTFEQRLAYSVTNRRNVVDAEKGRSSLTERRLDANERTTVVRVEYTDRAKGWSKRSFEIRDTYANVGAISGGPFQASERVKFALGTAITYGRITFSAANGSPFITYVQEYGAAAPASGSTVTGLTSGASCTTTSTPYSASPERVQEVQLFGVTRRSQAVRVARRQLQRAQLTPGIASWVTSFGDLDVLPGNVVEVSSDFLYWNAKKVIVMACAIDQQGNGLIEAREYDTDTYSDNVDVAVGDARYYAPGGALPPGLRNPSPAGAGGGSGDVYFGNSGVGAPPLGSSSTAGASSSSAGAGGASNLSNGTWKPSGGWGSR